MSNPNHNVNPPFGDLISFEEEPLPSQNSNRPSQIEASTQTNTASDEEETAIRHITFWRNGFKVENGPFKSYGQPENILLLREINAGRAPPSLLNVRTGQPVELRVYQRLDEDYVASTPRSPPPLPPRPREEGCCVT